MITISELHIYPIKSLGGISVDEVVVEEKGFQNDRRYMLVSPEGEFITQRTSHQMALLDVAIEGNELWVWHRANPDDKLILPLNVSYSDETMLVTIWDSKDVPASLVSAEADAWFSRVLAIRCRLVYMPESTHRAVDDKYARNNDAVSFADGYPYLLIGQASLDYLNHRIGTPMHMRRFRPNIVVTGSQPNEEDTWHTFRMGELTFYGVKPCARCVLTTVDPETAKLGKEPLRTLATYRQWKHKLLFGQNVLAQPTGQLVLGTLRVGQSLDVLEACEPWLPLPNE